jgi:hypothetical protein
MTSGGIARMNTSIDAPIGVSIGRKTTSTRPEPTNIRNSAEDIICGKVKLVISVYSRKNTIIEIEQADSVADKDRKQDKEQKVLAPFFF